MEEKVVHNAVVTNNTSEFKDTHPSNMEDRLVHNEAVSCTGWLNNAHPCNNDAAETTPCNCEQYNGALNWVALRNSCVNCSCPVVLFPSKVMDP